MAAQADPYTLIYNKIWEVIETGPVGELVRSGNMIKFSKEGADFDPRKPQVDYGSSPELMLIPDFFDANIQADNNSMEIDKHFTWIIRTGFRLVNKSLFPVEWQLLLAMVDVRDALVDLEGAYVTDVRVLHGSAQLPELTMSQALRGWRSSWTVRVSMSVDT